MIAPVRLTAWSFSAEWGRVRSIRSKTPCTIPRGDVIRLLRGVLEARTSGLVDEFDGRPVPRATKTGGAAAPTTAAPGAPRSGQSAPPEKLFVLPLKHVRVVEREASPRSSTLLRSYVFRRCQRVAKPGVPTLGGELLRQPRSLCRELAARRGGLNAADQRHAASRAEIRWSSPTREANSLTRPRQQGRPTTSSPPVVEQLDVRPLRSARRSPHAWKWARPFAPSPGRGRHPRDSPSQHRARRSWPDRWARQGSARFVLLSVLGIGGKDLAVNVELSASRGEGAHPRPARVAHGKGKQPAGDHITVSSQRPSFVQLQQSLPTEGTVSNQVVQYKDVGAS